MREITLLKTRKVLRSFQSLFVFIAMMSFIIACVFIPDNWGKLIPAGILILFAAKQIPLFYEDVEEEVTLEVVGGKKNGNK